MNEPFVTPTRSLGGRSSRRRLLRGIAAGLGWGAARLPGAAEARKRRKKKRKDRDPGPLCTRHGEACQREGAGCKARFCLRAPFTIAAVWESAHNHDTWLYVPPKDGTTGLHPQIDYDCTPANSACAEAYPFACVSGDDFGPGDEVATIHTLLPGTYEYWIASDPALAGELSVVLADRGGRVVRTWSNPTMTSALIPGWHVFDIDGATGRVTSVDAPPGKLPNPSTNVCPV